MHSNYSIFYEEDNFNIHAQGTFDIEDILDSYHYHHHQKQDNTSTNFTLSTLQNITENIPETDFGPRNQTPIESSRIKKQTGKIIEDKSLNLNKFVHHQTMIYLQKLQKCKILTEDELQGMERYRKSGNSFNSHFVLFANCQSLKEKCLQFYKSTQFVKKVMTCKSNYLRKLYLLKYLQKIQEFAESPKVKTRWQGMKTK